MLLIHMSGDMFTNKRPIWEQATSTDYWNVTSLPPSVGRVGSCYPNSAASARNRHQGRCRCPGSNAASRTTGRKSRKERRIGRCPCQSQSDPWRRPTLAELRSWFLRVARTSLAGIGIRNWRPETRSWAPGGGWGTTDGLDGGRRSVL